MPNPLILPVDMDMQSDEGWQTQTQTYQDSDKGEGIMARQAVFGFYLIYPKHS